MNYPAGKGRESRLREHWLTLPKCVLLDEPTGNLDKFTAGEIQSLLIDLNDSFDTSFIVVTHDELMANSMHRKLVLEGGTLHE